MDTALSYRAQGSTTTASAPKTVSSIKAKAAKKTLQLSWKSQKNVSYRIAYSTSSKQIKKLKNGSTSSVSNVKMVTAKKASVILKKLRTNKKYYIRICAVSTKTKKTGNWSKIVAKKTK